MAEKATNPNPDDVFLALNRKNAMVQQSYIEGKLAMRYLNQGDPQKALRAAQASQALHPTWETAVLIASIRASYFHTTDTTELQKLEQAGRHEPAAQDGYVDLGVAFGKNKDWKDAVACFQIAVKLSPTYSPAWSEWAWAMSSVGNWPATVSLANHAINLQPDDADSWQNLAYAQFNLHHWADSAKAYARLYRISPQSPASRIYWAMDEAAMGHMEKAENILSVEPGLAHDPYAQKYLALLRSGQKIVN